MRTTSITNDVDLPLNRKTAVAIIKMFKQCKLTGTVERCLLFSCFLALFEITHLKHRANLHRAAGGVNPQMVVNFYLQPKRTATIV